MRIHNTLTRKTEDFKPVKDGVVKLYTCGPTVYDYAHIGNLRSFVFDDTLRRALEAEVFEIKHVMNITDVGHLASDADEGEDKLEKGAQRENKTVWEVAEFYIKAFEKDAEKLNILPPNGFNGQHAPYARATDFISQQIEIIQLLLSKGFAYESEQAIYFDVTKLPDYGKLTGQKLADKEVAARSEVVVDQSKHHPQDFALWFFKVGRFANHSMSWPSPWGEGFPGWHLECSAIIHAVLDEPIDIHTGGVDHIGTHHTNEIAQSEAAFGLALANYWMHNEHLLVDGRKMAKSGGNFYSLKDITDKGYNPAALRLLFLQAHYRSQMNFTWNSLEGATVRLLNYRALADLRYQARSSAKPAPPNFYQHYQASIADSLSNDLATPEILSRIDNLITEVGDWGGVHPDSLKDFNRLLEYLDEILGLNLLVSDDISETQKQQINDRQIARQNQNWERSDEIRDSLLKQGIEINDTAAGPVWRRTIIS